MDVLVAFGPTSTVTDMYIDKAPGDEETDDAATCRAAPRDVVMLPDEEEEEAPLRERRRKGKGSSGRVLEVQAPQLTPVLETLVERSGDLARTSITFADPLTTDRPSGSTAPTPAAQVQLHASDPVGALTALAPSLFVVYQTPDDAPSAAREALCQVNLVMEQVKVMHEASQVAYNASTALQTNVKKSCDLGAQLSELNK